MSGVPRPLRVPGSPQAAGQAFVRMRRRTSGFPRKASPDSQLRRLLAAYLYVITPDAPPDHVFEVAAAALRGGADVLQLRHKKLARGELLALARRIREITTRSGALFIVNDHVDIALLSKADGVHLGPDDLSIPPALRIAAGRLLIAPSPPPPETAGAAIVEGADYLGSGPAFATPIKSEKQLIAPAGVPPIPAIAASKIPL